ncbi:MAG: SUMF1/EgtB/PvdO family nonheme iron enzyme [Phycisphaerales bacterium]
MTLNRLLRGGNWNNNSNNCRASQRNNNTPDNINNNIGFRVVSTPRLELRQEIAAGKAKSPGAKPGLPTSSCATRAGESRRSESSSHHRDLGIQPAVVLCCWETFAAAGAPFHAPPSLRANRKVAALRSARKRGVTQTMSAIKCCGENQIRLFWAII